MVNLFRSLRKNTAVFYVAFSSLIATGLIWYLRSAGNLQALELIAYDRLVRIASKTSLDPRLLIVEITEDDIQRLQSNIVSDRVVAQLIERLQEKRPKVIAIDLFRDIPHPPGRDELQEQLRSPNVVVSYRLPSSQDGKDAVLPPPEVPPGRAGFVDLPIDPDNVVRRNWLYSQTDTGDMPVYSLAFQIVRRFWGKSEQPIQASVNYLQFDRVRFERLRPNSGGYQLPPSEARGWQILLHFGSRKVAYRVSLQQALAGKVPLDLIRNRIVLIGYTAPSKKDTFPTPFSAAQTRDFEMPGVEIHAQMVSQLLGAISGKRTLFWFWSESQEILWVFGWSLLGGIVAWRFGRPLSLGAAVLLVVWVLWLVCWRAFQELGWIPLVPPGLALLVSGATVLAYKVFYRTYHDPLTGLPNRRLFVQKLKRANRKWRESNSPLIAVLFLDLDRFKTINDGLGYAAGDFLLETIANRLRGKIPNTAALARVGGDEFAILLPKLSHPKEASNLADRLQQDLSQSFRWKDRDIFTTVSIGVAIENPSQAMQSEELIRYADIAMIEAKKQRKARHEVFVRGMDRQVEQRWQLETELRDAIKNQDFTLHYQPIFRLKDRKLAGFEALVRWNSSERGLVSPNDFIPLAEETGLIVPLGLWILREACRQMCLWHGQYPQEPPLFISVNLSSRQFNQPDLVMQVAEVLQETQLERESLKLEITESMVMNDVESAINLLNELKALGLRLSIDDFGTGYSSLSYLHRFPIDTLKVDRSFVSRIANRESSPEKYTQIARTIVMLGHNLGLDVTAEGIETEAQLLVLNDLDCKFGQGYFFDKPLSVFAAEELLANNLRS